MVIWGREGMSKNSRKTGEVIYGWAFFNYVDKTR